MLARFAVVTGQSGHPVWALLYGDDPDPLANSVAALEPVTIFRGRCIRLVAPSARPWPPLEQGNGALVAEVWVLVLDCLVPEPPFTRWELAACLGALCTLCHASARGFQIEPRNLSSLVVGYERDEAEQDDRGRAHAREIEEEEADTHYWSPPSWYTGSE